MAVFAGQVRGKLIDQMITSRSIIYSTPPGYTEIGKRNVIGITQGSAAGHGSLGDIVLPCVIYCSRHIGKLWLAEMSSPFGAAALDAV